MSFVGRTVTARQHTVTALAAVLATAAVAVPARAASTGAQTYAKRCQNQSKQPAAGTKATPFNACVTAMGRLARAQSRSPRMACAAASRTRAGGARTSPFDKCVAAGTALVKHGNGVDRAYVEQMIPHHVAAVEMARMALTQTQTPYVQSLAQSIISSQNAEIARMRSIAARLRAAGMKAVSLGLTKAQMGMDHDMSHLVGASPFDVAFVDMMIPHHQGAITMSQVVFAKGVSADVRQLAEQITNAQRQEIRQMRDFRASVTGSPESVAGEGEQLHTHPGNEEPHPH
jgi:uncharacterized protein (DUF305 family)